MSTKENQRHQLATMRRTATYFFLAALLVFITSSIAAVRQESFLLHCVVSTSEAAMIGALADWFAVVALFRKPFGVRFAAHIPYLNRLILDHVEIIPRNKERIGNNLGNFIRANFINSKKLRTRLPYDLVGWVFRRIATEDNSARLVDATLRILPSLLDTVDDKDVRAFASRSAAGFIRSIKASSVAELLDILTAHGRHQELLDKALELTREIFEEYKPHLKESISNEFTGLGGWALRTFFNGDVVLYNKSVEKVHESLHAVSTDRNHDLRRRFSQYIEDFIDNLRTSAEYQARWDVLKDQLLRSEMTAQWLNEVWDELKEQVLRDVASSDSRTRSSLLSLLSSLASNLETNESARRKINEVLREVLFEFVDSFGPDLSNFIARGIHGWSDEELVEKIELEVGKDLQYIRINGTIIGGLVGLSIALARYGLPAALRYAERLLTVTF